MIAGSLLEEAVDDEAGSSLRNRVLFAIGLLAAFGEVGVGAGAACTLR